MPALPYPATTPFLRPGKNALLGACCALLCAGLAGHAAAQITPSKESLSDLYPGKAYSPYAERRFPDRVFWGDTHLHTGLSVDAGLFGARLGLEDAYRFARGEEVMASSGQPVRLGRPLDWLVIADHSDGMGLIGDLAAAADSVNGGSSKLFQVSLWNSILVGPASLTVSSPS